MSQPNYPTDLWWAESNFKISSSPKLNQVGSL